MASGTAELVADPDRADAYTLLLDGTPQSHVDLADPRRLEFEYVRHLAYAIDTLPDGPVAALHLGGGGLTLPRYVSVTRPGSAQRVVEIDGPLVEWVRRELPLPRDCRPKIRVGDAREAVESLRPNAFDVVIADVFAHAATPPRLTTIEFVSAVRRLLAPGGIYLANVADGAGLRFARAQAATVRAVFAETLLIADPGVLRGRRYGNLVLVAADRPLPEAELTRRAAGDAFPARVVPGEALAAFTGGAAPVTDESAVPQVAPRLFLR